MTVEDMRSTLIRNYQSESDAFYDIFDSLMHIPFEGTDIHKDNQDVVNNALEIAWSRHAALENLIARLEDRPCPYE
jgi:hypothetical protein